MDSLSDISHGAHPVEFYQAGAEVTYFEKMRAIQTIRKEQPPPKDKYHTLDRREQIIIFCLRTGHNRLNKHSAQAASHQCVPVDRMNRLLNMSCRTSCLCPLYYHQRRTFWPSELALHSKIMELLTAIEFIKSTRLTLDTFNREEEEESYYYLSSQWKMMTVNFTTRHSFIS
ncbi:hypothetical protein BsWGS_05656 [Bradybaena similaris]